MAGSESISSALRPRRPSSKTWNMPHGPAPTMTASVTVASFARSGDKGFLQGNRRAFSRRRGELRETLGRVPLRVEQTGLIFGATITEDGDDRVAGAELLRDAHGGSHVDAARAAEEEAFLIEQPVDEAHRFRVLDMDGIVDLRSCHVGSDARDADAFGDGTAAGALERTVLRPLVQAAARRIRQHAANFRALRFQELADAR